jgi:hypothetical protein
LDSDLVIWYGIHVGHNHPTGPQRGEPDISGELVAGPDLVPVHW